LSGALMSMQYTMLKNKRNIMTAKVMISILGYKIIMNKITGLNTAGGMKSNRSGLVK